MTGTFRTAIVLVGAASALGLVAAPAEARSKAYCRAYAEDYANDRVDAGDVLEGTALGAMAGAIIGLGIDGKEGAGKGALIGGAGGTVLGGAHANKKWRRAYRDAYAECRAS